jgi:hypothetical protein
MPGFTAISFVDALDAFVFQFFEGIFVVVGVLRYDGVDGVSILAEQFAQAIALVVQGVVELFLGHLFELFDELDNVFVLILACVVGVECDLFELFGAPPPSTHLRLFWQKKHQVLFLDKISHA